MAKSAHNRKWALRTGAIAVVGLTLTGIYAFRATFQRDSDNALKYVPADALVDVTIDWTPTPEHALTFKHIQDAADRDHVSDFVSKTLDSMSQSPGISQLRAMAGKSINVCVFSNSDKPKDMGGAFLVQVSDPARAEYILKTNGSPEFWKGTKFYRLKNAPVVAMVVGSQLILAPDGPSEHKIGQVAEGQARSILSAPGFAAARPTDAGSATVIAYVSSKMAQTMSGQPSTGAGSWSSMTATVEDDGLSIVGHNMKDGSGKDPMAFLKDAKPLRTDLLQVLPSGAYAVVAVSQPSKYLDYASNSHISVDIDKMLAQGKKSVKDQTGLDIDTDIEQAFTGDAIVAAYPSQEPTAGADLLVVVDNQNGANPELLADKLQRYADQQVAKSKSPTDWSRKIDRPDATEYRLSDKVEKEMKGHTNGGSPIRMDVLTGDKTLAWAKVNGAVLIGSSQQIVDKAISAYEGKEQALAADKELAGSLDPADGSQMVEAFDLARIATGVKNTIDESQLDANARKTFDQVLGLFQGLTTPLSARFTITSDGNGSSRMFIPLDYDKLFDVVGPMINHQNQPGAGAQRV